MDLTRAPRTGYTRLVCTLMVVALACALLAGCGTPAAPTATPEPAVITFAFLAYQADYYDDLIEKFNDQSPEVKVERRTVRSGETWSYLFEQGEIDTFALSTEGSLLVDLKRDDKLLSLSPFIQQDTSVDLDDYYASVLEPFTMEGSVWALPNSVNLAVMYYNADLFDQYGVSYPTLDWTWDDLLEAGLWVRDPDEGVYGFVAFPHFTVPFIYQHGGRLVDDWERPTRLTLDDPLTVEAVEWFADLVLDYDVMPSPETASELYGQDGDASYIYWRRKAGMFVGWLSDAGGQTWGPDGRWPMEWGMVPLPRDVQSSTLAFVYGHAATADTEYPEAAWEWLKFLDEQMAPYTMPAKRSLAESEAYRESAGEAAAAVALASIDDALVVYSATEGPEFNFEAYIEAIVAVLNGEIPASEALLELQRQSESG